MKKASVSFRSGLLRVLLAVGLLGAIGLGAYIFGITRCTPGKIGFTDFPQYRDFDADIRSIDVSWDIGRPPPVLFTISDTATVETVVRTLLRDVRFVKDGTGPYDGGHSAITLKDGNGHETVLVLGPFTYGTTKVYYLYETDGLYELIRQIGRQSGALEAAVS